MKYCRQLNKSFSSTEDLFKGLRENASLILDQKKAQIQKSCEKGASVTCKPIDTLKLASTVKALEVDKDYYYIAVNTTKILDSHGDVHVDGIWNKTVKDQQGKNYLVADHKLEMDKVIAKKEHIEMFVAEIPFSMVGKSYEGNTQALIYKVRKDKIQNATGKEWLESGDAIEASVRMQYVTVDMALNSTDKADVMYKKVYDDYVGQIANKADFEEIPYFFVIREAKNIKESSLVVFGSNDSTGVLQDKQEPQSTLAKDDAAAKALQLNQFFNNLKL